MFSSLYTFCLHFYLINIHIFDYPDSRLSGLFTEVPTSPDNRGSTVYKGTSRYTQNSNTTGESICSRSRINVFLFHVFVVEYPALAEKCRTKFRSLFVSCSRPHLISNPDLPRPGGREIW